MTKYTTTSIISPSKRNEYCPGGEKVEVVHISGNVAICEWKGNRFPCSVSKLSDEPVHTIVKLTKKLTDKEAKFIEDYNEMRR